jgi:hypothetical protein
MADDVGLPVVTTPDEVAIALYTQPERIGVSCLRDGAEPSALRRHHSQGVEIGESSMCLPSALEGSHVQCGSSRSKETINFHDLQKPWKGSQNGEFHSQVRVRKNVNELHTREVNLR